MLCYVTGALALGGAGAYVMFGSRKDVGCLLVIVAVILCRVLVLNVAEGR